MRAEETAHGEALLAAFVRDLDRHPVEGALVRVILRWFASGFGPIDFTVHVLGSETARVVDAPGAPPAPGFLDPDDPWSPLEWPNVEAELARSERLARDPGLVAAVERLNAVWAVLDPEAEELVEEPPLPVRVFVEGLPAALAAGEHRVAPHFAVSAQQFEGHGSRELLEACAGPATLDALRARGLLPLS